MAGPDDGSLLGRSCRAPGGRERPPAATRGHHRQLGPDLKIAPTAPRTRRAWPAHPRLDQAAAGAEVSNPTSARRLAAAVPSPPTHGWVREYQPFPRKLRAGMGLTPRWSARRPVAQRDVSMATPTAR